MTGTTLFTGFTLVGAGGTSVVALYGPMLGGIIANPAAPEDQGLETPEPLYVSYTGPALLVETPTTFALKPGTAVVVPASALNVWVNAATSGHRFSAIAFQSGIPFPPMPVPGTFPPAGPTSVLKTIPSYLFVQYNNDDTLQAFVAAFNEMAQQYVDWFNATPLGDYTSDAITGDLLDWVANGLYGMSRPSLPAGNPQIVGPFNTWTVNTVPFNYYKVVGGGQFFATTDDTFKRILTWHLYKADGKFFNVRWLKRRIARFLTGANGGAGETDQTYDISVTMSAPNNVAIDVGVYAPILQEAIKSGALELPFQFNFSVNLP